MGGLYYHTESTFNGVPKLLPHNQEVVRHLKSFHVIPNEFHDVILVRAYISTKWQRCRKMHEFYVVNSGMY